MSGTARVPVSVVIPTLNESARIGDAIASVDWAAEVIVADGGSTDDTLAAAARAGAITLASTGPTIGAQRNAAIDRAAQPWILALDADESATPALRDELVATIAAPQHDVYRIRRQNTYLGRVMRHGHMARDWHICFFRNTHRYNDARVHERLVGVDATGRLAGPILHTPYADLAHHAEKLARYARWAAADRVARGRRATLVDLVLRGPVQFKRDYILYGGWLDGWQGAVAAVMSGFSAFLRAAFIREMQDRAR
jgi:glycosyltransferase involved in cell wall biosynthesis